MTAPPTTSGTTPSRPPLLLTRDGALAEEVTRLAAAAGTSLDVVTDPASALRAWGASLVLVGADAVGGLAPLAPRRRPDTWLVGWGPLPDAAFRDALAVGADLAIELPDGAAGLTEGLADVGDRPRTEGLVVGVVGGSGGAGATTLACALAQVAGRAGRAVVVDLDPVGPGVDRVLGVDSRPGVRWDDLAVAPGRLGATSLREALPAAGGVAALTWLAGSTSPVPPATAREALAAARRGHDVVVLDLPRTFDDVGLEALSRCSAVVVVVRPTVAGVASAARLVARLPDRGRAGLVLRLGGSDAGDPAQQRRLAAVVGARVLAVSPDQRGLAESVDLGLGPVRSRRGPLVRTCRELLDAVGAAARVAA